MEPWLAGNARGPSTAFCLLYRLFELKPSEEEVQATINHEDSVYIRAVSLWQLELAQAVSVPPHVQGAYTQTLGQSAKR